MLCLRDLTSIGWQSRVRFVNRDWKGTFLIAGSLQTVRGGSGTPKGISTEECLHRKLCPRITSQQRLAITDNLIFLYSLPLQWRVTMQCPRVVEEWELLAIKIFSKPGPFKFIGVDKIFWASCINEYHYRFSFNFAPHGRTRETNWEVKSRRGKQGLTVVGSSRRMRSTDTIEMPFLFTIFANWVSG